ncbi:MAG: 4'-phosphopantetheinyl transferase superfamily protein [Nocardioidaceae bacterium]|nr:4'-phosphopantetheinyl transferase superfamily protein [Nocardioidaceae bacterium]
MTLGPLVMGTLLHPPSASAVAPGDPAVWVVRTEDIEDAELDEGRAWLDDDERGQAASYVRAELRRSYEVAHIAARSIVGEAIGVGPRAVRWGRHACPRCGEPHGRPRVEGADVEFSLSHTPGLVLVTLADHPVGIDAERCPEPEGLPGMVGVLHPDEAREVAATDDPREAVLRFTRAWTRTEAYLKGLGVGLGRDPQQDYLGSSTDPERFIDGWRVRDVTVPEGYAAAVAVHVA